MLLQVCNGASFFLVTVIGLLWSLSIPATVDAEKGFCPEEASVDLTNAKQNASGYLDEFGHFFPIETVRNEDIGLRGCMCDLKTCVPLCPLLKDEFGRTISANYFASKPIEISIFHTTNLSFKDDGNLSFGTEEWFHFFTSGMCIGRPYDEFFDYGTDKWYLFENGSLFIPRRNGTKILLDWGQYCLWKELNYTTYIPLTCVAPPSNLFAMVFFIGVLISVPLLIATIIVYSVLPQLQNIHGKTLSRYLGCLLVMNISRAIESIYPSIFDMKFVCSIFEFILYFSYLTSFLWLNVMCFDMWWRFGGRGSIRNRERIEDRKKLIGYSIYAWGIPVVMSAICLCWQYLPGVPVSGIRIQSCFYGTADEFYITLALIFLSIICNTCLFVLTSIKLIQHQRNSRRHLSSGDSKRHDDNQLQLLSVNLKLFVIMGISWSMVFIQTFWHLNEYVFYFMILFNELQGIPIFVVLVCKKKIWQSLKMRFKW